MTFTRSSSAPIRGVAAVAVFVRRCVASLSKTLVALTVVLVALDAAALVEIDWCAAQRPSHTSKSDQLWKHGSELLGALTLGIAAFAAPHRRAHALFHALLAFAWYLSSFFLCQSLKVLLADTTCSKRHSNSVSGHFSYYTYITLTALDLHLSVHRPRSCRMQFLVLFSAHVVVASRILLGTWSGGYHSPRQILLGILLGLFAHQSFIEIGDWVRVRPGRRYALPLHHRSIFTQLLRLQVPRELLEDSFIHQEADDDDSYVDATHVQQINRAVTAVVAMLHGAALLLVFLLPEQRYSFADILLSLVVWSIMLVVGRAHIDGATGYPLLYW